jgi:hypothetical protein
MLLLFTFDDQADRSTPEEVSSNGEVLVDGLSYPEKSRPKGEWVGGEFGRQYEPFSFLLYSSLLYQTRWYLPNY